MSAVVQLLSFALSAAVPYASSRVRLCPLVSSTVRNVRCCSRRILFCPFVPVQCPLLSVQSPSNALSCPPVSAGVRSCPDVRLARGSVDTAPLCRGSESVARTGRLSTLNSPLMAGEHGDGRRMGLQASEKRRTDC